MSVVAKGPQSVPHLQGYAERVESDPPFHSFIHGIDGHAVGCVHYH